MAQARLGEYFSSKKRSSASNPAKKRKLATDHDNLKLAPTPSLTFGADDQEKQAPVVLKAVPEPTTGRKPTTRRGTKETTKSTRSRASTRKKDLAGQVTIQNAFAKSTEAPEDGDLQSETIEITSQWDEHDGPETPKRKTRPPAPEQPQVSDKDSVRVHRKARRTSAELAAAQTPSKEGEALKEEEMVSRRKSLAQSFQRKFADKEQIADAEKLSQPCLPTEAEIKLNFGLEDPVPVSPLHPTPQNMASPTKQTLTVTSPKVKATMDKCKLLQKEPASVYKKRGGARKDVIAPEVLRERLTKCGKLDSLKAKLAEMNSSLKAVKQMEKERQKAELEKETKAADVAPSVEEPKPSPAYEKYAHLAAEGPPSLALPGKYAALLGAFQGADTVVSMLYNRQETITFSKLQAAVQSITRKNFAERMLGQMKTVYPDAYNFRQEKGLVCFGNKTSGYQLTVQPNLDGVEKDGKNINPDGKPCMSAAAMLKRKRIFHNSLVNITKDLHTDFLSKLTPPLTVPSAKLTRWHPKFGLDSVPDVEVADLPQVPAIATQTARQVLEAAKGKLPPKVEAAMTKVAEASEKSQPAPPPKPSSDKPASASLKGIPLGLLEKIRAKEAAKTQASLMRDPKETKRIAMLNRLPALIRSLRTFYVTEKKPSLPMATVIQKLADSYTTCISKADVEAHLNLIIEVAPKWLQIIQIARGKFVKIDKNMEINQILSSVSNIAKKS